MPELDSIRDLIIEGKLKEALTNLLTLLDSNDRRTRKLRDGVIILHSKFQDLNRKETLGLIEANDALREKGQINDGLLNIISDIEAGTAPMPPEQTTHVPKQWWWLLLLLIPVGVVGIFWKDIFGNGRKEPSDKTVVVVRQASLSMEETIYDFGTVIPGNTVLHTFRFRNTGDTALLISQVQANGGFAVRNWPQYPIRPSENGEITVAFDTHGKSGQQSGQITIHSNTNPAQTILTIQGNVQGVIVVDLPIARFRVENGGFVAPCTVRFINESQNADNFAWNFGDGGTSSQRNPTHRYLAAGVYQIRLVAHKGTRSDNENKSVTIIAPPENTHCDAWVQNWIIINKNHGHMGKGGKDYTSSIDLLSILNRLNTSISATLRTKVMVLKNNINLAPKETANDPKYDLEFTPSLKHIKKDIKDQIRMQVYIPVHLTPLFRFSLTPLFRTFDPPKC